MECNAKFINPESAMCTFGKIQYRNTLTAYRGGRLGETKP